MLVASTEGIASERCARVTSASSLFAIVVVSGNLMHNAPLGSSVPIVRAVALMRATATLVVQLTNATSFSAIAMGTGPSMESVAHVYATKIMEA